MHVNSPTLISRWMISKGRIITRYIQTVIAWRSVWAKIWSKEMYIISNLFITLYAVKSLFFKKTWGVMLFKFQWHFEKHLQEPAISFVIFWEFLMFYQIFLSPQVKWWVIITYKLGIYELSHELLNDERLRILGN